MIFIFNPETDYALASGSAFYTPPARIISLRNRMALMPACFCREGDFVAVPEGWNPDMDETGMLTECDKHGIGIVKYQEIAQTLSSIHGKEKRIVPWGWNAALLRQLMEVGVDPCLMPTESYISKLRNLQHRRNTIAFNTMLGSLLPMLKHQKPEELFTASECIDFWKKHPGCYFKAPWSSSGRGVMWTQDLEEKHIHPWTRGIIQRQGSVMAEIGVERALDFATEWICTNGEAKYAGVSVFSTSSRGKYHGNMELPQQELNRIIAAASSLWNDDVVKAQKHTLESVVAPFYNGPVGIDMMISTHGEIFACVEMNLRITMGMVAIPEFRNFIHEIRYGLPSIQ